MTRGAFAATLCLALLRGAMPAAAPDHQHDFDFEFGKWTVLLRRLVHPLTGSHTWVEYSGTSVVRTIWNGRANLGELEVEDRATHARLEGLSLRLYNRATGEWSLYFANSGGGGLGVPTVGRFEHGRGEFYDREELDGKPIVVRFVFSGVTSTAFRFEQSFSGDGGGTWEPNWIATFSRVPSD